IERASPEQLVRKPAGEDWSAAGVAGHLIEMIPYWADKATAVAADPSAPISRSLDAPERLGAVIEGEKLSPAEAAGRLREAAEQAGRVLRSVPTSAWTLVIDHPRLGRVSLDYCVS